MWRGGVGVCKYGLLAKLEVKMAEYWPSFFFACLWVEAGAPGRDQHKHAKKERGHYPAILTDRSFVNRAFIIQHKTPKNDL